MRATEILNNFLEMNGFEASAAYDVEQDSYYDIDEEHIVLGGKSVLAADALFIDYCNELGIEHQCSIDTLSFLHELGHHCTLHLLTDKEIEISNMINLRCLLKEESEEVYNMYFRCPEESIATQWAVDFVNEHWDIVEALDRELRNELGEVI